MVRLIDHVLHRLPQDAKLFPASSASFRRRFDRSCRPWGLLKQLASLPLASGRGALRFHFLSAGGKLPGLLWGMRLKHLGTLESYLQEVSASTVVPHLSLESRRRISVASACLPAVLQLTHVDIADGGNGLANAVD